MNYQIFKNRIHPFQFNKMLLRSDNIEEGHLSSNFRVPVDYTYNTTFFI